MNAKKDMEKIKRRLALFRALPAIHDWLLDLDDIMKKKYALPSATQNQDRKAMMKIITIMDRDWRFNIRCKLTILVESQERK